VSVALDQKVRYYGEHLSDHIAKTPEGYLICRDAVIGRSGFQDYQVSELTDPEKLLKDRQGSEQIKIWRDPDEVFSPATLASFESKTFTLRHPDDLLDAENDKEHHVGHVQNVHKGTEPLDSGDWPMLADIIVKDAEAIRAIDNGDRELSCGYSYKLAKDGERYEQRNIIGNHVALVQKGRAGADARINDAAPPQKETRMENVDWIKKLLGLGLKEVAKDAKPEELAEAAGAVRHAADDDKAKDAELTAEEKAKLEAEKVKAADAKAKDGDEHASRMHAALDRVLKQAGDKKSAADTDLDELGKLLGEYFQEEKGEAEHAGDDKKAADAAAAEEAKKAEEAKAAADKAKDDKSELEEVAPISQDEAKPEEKKEEKADDEGAIVHPEPELEKKQVPESQFDSALHVLRQMRPIIARSKDQKAIDAFNTQLAWAKAGKDGGGTGVGDYAMFAAATQRSQATDAATGETAAQRRAREFEETMAKAAKERSHRGKQGVRNW
jgi:hypothetical protein